MFFNVDLICIVNTSSVFTTFNRIGWFVYEHELWDQAQNKFRQRAGYAMYDNLCEQSRDLTRKIADKSLFTHQSTNLWCLNILWEKRKKIGINFVIETHITNRIDFVRLLASFLKWFSRIVKKRLCWFGKMHKLLYDTYSNWYTNKTVTFTSTAGEIFANKVVIVASDKGTKSHNIARCDTIKIIW